MSDVARDDSFINSFLIIFADSTIITLLNIFFFIGIGYLSGHNRRT